MKHLKIETKGPDNQWLAFLSLNLDERLIPRILAHVALKPDYDPPIRITIDRPTTTDGITDNDTLTKVLEANW